MLDISCAIHKEDYFADFSVLGTSGLLLPQGVATFSFLSDCYIYFFKKQMTMIKGYQGTPFGGKGPYKTEDLNVKIY